MIKIREAYYCNLKVLLLFLVILGHGIEPYISESGYIGEAYRIIYTVHMPLFAFVTGMFLKTEAACKKQAALAAAWYLSAQGIFLIIRYFVLHETWSFARPYWHLWYLMSLCWWSLIGFGVLRLRKKGISLWIILCAAAASACFSGLASGINRQFSLSRTIVFLPYILIGQAVPTDFFRKMKPVYAVLPIAAFIALYLLSADRISTDFFYRANSDGFIVWQEGILNRLLCFTYAFLLGAGILCLISGRRYVFTKIGANTMPAYLLHVLALPLLKKAMKIVPCYVSGSALFAVLFLVLIFELSRWFQNCYAITQCPVCRKSVTMPPASACRVSEGKKL